MVYSSNAMEFCSLLDKSLSKAFAISEEDSMCPNAMICSIDTCFLDYLSNGKSGRSGKSQKEKGINCVRDFYKLFLPII